MGPLKAAAAATETQQPLATGKEIPILFHITGTRDPLAVRPPSSWTKEDGRWLCRSHDRTNAAGATAAGTPEVDAMPKPKDASVEQDARKEENESNSSALGRTSESSTRFGETTQESSKDTDAVTKADPVAVTIALRDVQGTDANVTGTTADITASPTRCQNHSIATAQGSSGEGSDEAKGFAAA